MEFVEIKDKINRNGTIEIYPNFRVRKCCDLMVRGNAFYAIWDNVQGMWSTDEYDVQRLVDEELMAYKEMMKANVTVHTRTLGDFSSNMWSEFQAYIKNKPDNAHQLDENLTFSNTEVKREDFASKRLPYPLAPGPMDAYEELIGTLYSPEEKDKLEWAIGGIIDGESKNIQKFIVLYGEAGSGKSTVLNIIQKLFVGYYTTFEAKALTSANNAFATESFKNNPLVAIQHDGDLSKIEDNTKLNSIVSHEVMSMNEKYKASYMSRTNCFLFMGTNKPVKITDAKSGIIRRLIDVRPSGEKVTTRRYQVLVSQIDFELGAIASHCLEKYRSLGKNYYSNYRPIEMMLQTDVFFNFAEAYYHVFKEQDGVSLTVAYEMYKTYCDESNVEFKLPKYKFREELKNYFKQFSDMTRVDGKQVRSYYTEFLVGKFTAGKPEESEHPYSLTLDSTESLFDDMCEGCFAQYATSTEIPSKKWEEVTTKLSNLNTKRLHYVKVPSNHIVIDFDIKDEAGNKSLEKNIEAASKWPATYAELSKGESGVHLHYLFDGDVDTISRIYDIDIEIKVFNGNASLRRKFTKCNNTPVATISSGLPLKGEKVVNFETVKNEKAIRSLIKKNLKKEIHPGTKSSVDFIWKILDESYKSGIPYDVTDMRPQIMAFAANSTNQSSACLKLFNQMEFASKEISPAGELNPTSPIIFLDIEVYPNLLIVAWKATGKKTIKMINPTPREIEEIIKYRIIGFNCRRYDNHILYARLIGYDNAQLFILSQRIIANSRNATFGEAYNISYADVYDFTSDKKSLKKYEIELGLHHQEMGLPWDQPVEESLWPLVADYCENDVIATEAVFYARKQDFIARQIIAELSGLSINDTTQMHTAKIIFGTEKKPQDKFIYTDLSEMFPGYEFVNGKSMYRGEEVGEGGYIHAEPGMYDNVPVLDIESMHPNSLIELNAFGPYTPLFKQLLDARIAIKHKDYELAKGMLNGILTKYLGSEEDSKALSFALKIVINIVYGLTSAKFENKFKDPRNIDNIVAKRGALFMIDLKHAVQERGFIVAHIKTDSIKIPNATPEIMQFVSEFGLKYGYKFEHETTYEKLCLVNDSVYIAKIAEGLKGAGEWTATGKQFAVPYVYKTLFSHEPIVFRDLVETFAVSTALYLDMNEGDEENHRYQFIGKVGAFCPIKEGRGGGVLLREKDEKYNSASGSKGYRWLETEMVTTLKKEDDIDVNYYIKLVDDAVTSIKKFGDIEQFLSEDNKNDSPPWDA